MKLAGSVVARCLALVAALGPVGAAAQTDISDVPLLNAVGSQVRPNVMFVLDDSGSMGYDFMPDNVSDYTCRSFDPASPANPTAIGRGYNAPCCREETVTDVYPDGIGNLKKAVDNFRLDSCWRGEAPFGTYRGAPPFLTSDINRIYYNPTIRYEPPATPGGGRFASMTSDNTGGWAAVPNDAYGVESRFTTNLLTQFPDAEWCTDSSFSDCLRNGNYVLPGVVGGKVYSVFHATVATGSGSIAVGEPDEARAEARDFGPHYYRIRPAEYCDATLSRCQTTFGGIYRTPVSLRWCNNETNARALVPAAGSCQGTRTPNPDNRERNFVVARYPTKIFGDGVFPGAFERVDIVPGIDFDKSAARTDCAGARCTYDEEMTNFANWWAYYRSRMQAMKSSTSLAFEPRDDSIRLGYASINNSAGTDFLNLDTFDGDHRANWFSKLQAARPNGGTPLRSALSTIGRLYGGRLNGRTLNGGTVTEPMQYSCQRNYTILSTDGFWNEGATPTRLDASTAIGDQDGELPRPLLDGTGSSDTLADVAAYYYETDLRTDCGGGDDLCTDNVPGAEGEPKHQRMSTFSIGLGASGVMQFSLTYAADNEGDFAAIRRGLPADPDNGVCAWQSGGTCNWPVPIRNTLTAIDDLWHAAVNGRGSYFSASNPTELYFGLEDALDSIDQPPAAAAATTITNPNLTGNGDVVFSSGYNPSDWTGTLVGLSINEDTGQLGAEPLWDAGARLNANTNRRIFTFAPGGGNKLKPFAWESLTEAERALFSLSHVRAAGRGLQQFCLAGITCLDPAAQAAATGKPLVDFLRGDRTNEAGAGERSKFFRPRNGLLGDIVNSEAVYVGEPVYSYADPDYAAFKASQANRPGTVYVGANDGMLHAFDASADSSGGTERWAYVPSMLMPELYRLADKNYADRHRYFVDGSPVIGDIRVGGAWRTILVSGLGAGGRGYFALDVTDPENPQALWEFTHDTSKSGPGYTTDANLGLSMGKAEITKLRDGTWVVIVASGYNNIAPGNGRGYLYVLDAFSGALIRTIDTGVGSAAAPAGLAHVRAWVDATAIDNTTLRVYGGDLLGNLWRFDVNGDIGEGGFDAQLLATLTDGAGQAQPITSRPELGRVGGAAVVYVGTGRFLGLSDVGDSSPQTLYAIKDELTAVGYGAVRGDAGFKEQTLTGGDCPPGVSICTAGSAVRTGSSNPVNLAVDKGWYIDLPAGERSTNEPVLGLGTIVFTTNLSSGDPCAVGGSSFLNFFDYRTGAPVTTSSGVVSRALGSALASRASLARRKDEKVVSVTRLSNQTNDVGEVPIAPITAGMRRVSWRELTLEP